MNYFRRRRIEIVGISIPVQREMRSKNTTAGNRGDAANLRKVLGVMKKPNNAKVE
jgi:hypothetical protein